MNIRPTGPPPHGRRLSLRDVLRGAARGLLLPPSGADPRAADEKLRLAEKVIQGRDFTAMVETVNTVDAWLGSLPGHAYANVRQPPISTTSHVRAAERPTSVHMKMTRW